MDFVQLAKVYQGTNESKTGKSSAQDDVGKFVEQRFYDMSYAKQQIREIWQGTEDLYYCNDWEWIVKEEGFDRPVRLPTLRDFTKTLVDEFMKDPPDIILHPKGLDNEQSQDLIIGKKAYIDQRRKSIHEKRVRRQVFEDMFFFGKGFREVCYWDLTKEIDGEQQTLFKDVATIRHDPRNVFVDEQAIILHDKLRLTGARDIIIRRIPAQSTFNELCRRHPEWDQEKCKAVQAENYYTTYGLDYIVTNSREVTEKSPLWVVKFYEYMNQELNFYALVAGGVCIYSTTLSKAKGTTSLPVVDYSFEPRNDSYWGNNLAQIIAPHIWLKDTIFNLEILNVKLTLQPVVAVSGGFGYNPATHFLQPGGVWEAGGTMNGKLEDNIQPLIAGNSNTKSAELLQRLDSELSITTHSDIRSMMFYPDKTATEVMRQNQMTNSHNEQIESITEIESEAIVYELFLEVMKSFMSGKDEKGNVRRVRIKDYSVTKRTTSGASFEKKAGMDDSFVLSEEMINEEAEVEVIDCRTQKAQKLEQLGRIMQAIPMIGNIIQISPEVILPKIDIVGMLSQLVEAIGLDPDRTFVGTDNIYDEFEATQEEIMLGHEVGVPQDEDRKESLIRLKYFLDFAKTHKEGGDKLTADQQQALQFHINATLQNIMANHIDQKRAMAAQQNQQVPPPPTAGQEQQAQAVQKNNQRSQQIGSPDPSLLNHAGHDAQQLH